MSESTASESLSALHSQATAVVDRKTPVTPAAECLTTKTWYSEDLRVGQQWESPLRAISEEDVETFAELTGDYDPLHDSDSSQVTERAQASGDAPAISSPFGRPVAHGLLGMSVLAGLGTEYPRAATLALVAITDWQFENPIFFGDRVRVINEIEHVQPHGRRAAKVTWHRRLVAEDGRTLQAGKFVTLVASKNRANVNGAPRRPR